MQQALLPTEPTPPPSALLDLNAGTEYLPLSQVYSPLTLCLAFCHKRLTSLSSGLHFDVTSEAQIGGNKLDQKSISVEGQGS